MRLVNHDIGLNFEPIIVAEMSGNHNQSLENAIKIVDKAADVGVKFLKIQTYTADTMTIDLNSDDFFISDKKSLWSGNSLYDLYNKAYTPWEWHKPIMDHAKKRGIICFSTPFDESAVDFLETLDVPLYKIASFENNNPKLIKKVCKTKKPIIISTGLSTITQISELVEVLKSENHSEYILLKCTSSYPSTPSDSNILTIPHMRELFNCEVGLSDHTMGIGAPIAAVAHGATLIEKHFTLDRSEGGVDSEFSLEPQEMKSLIIETKRAWQALGKISYDVTKNEKNSLKFKRSIFITEDIRKNEIISSKNIRIIRPGNGLNPKYYDLLIGRKVKNSIKKGTPASWDLFL